MKKEGVKNKISGTKLLVAVVFWILLVSTLSMVSAKDQSFTVSYNPDVGGEYERTIDFSSVMLKVTTFNNSVCKYDNSPGLSYSSMDSVFEDTGSSRHSVSFLNLEDSTYNYYIKCKAATFSGEPEEFHLILRVNSLVTGEVRIDKSSPINDEKIKVRLETSKNVQDVPSLTYSYNGVSYLPLTLIGSGDEFLGELVMNDDLEEGVLSFKMVAYDLEGRKGTQIVSGTYFSYDFVKPVTVVDFRVNSEEDEVEIEWDYDENVDYFNIYKSEFSNLDSLDFYKEVQGNKEKYIDTDVDTGKTYYYRITAVDFAGNEGDFSRELSGTGLYREADKNSGLSPQLYGVVDSFLVEVNSVIDEAESSLSDFSSRSGKEGVLVEKLGIIKEVESAKDEAESIKSSVEKYKDQELTKESLENKISQNKVKLGIIEKKIPNELTISDEKSRTESLTNEKQDRAILEINNIISDKTKERSIKESNKILDENPLKVSSTFYNVKIDYVGGAKSEYSVISRVLDSKLIAGEGQYFIERISDSVLTDTSLIEVVNRNYDLIGEGNVISFETDAKEIFYYIPKVTNFRNLEDIEFSFVKVLEDDDGKQSTITGFSIFEAGGDGYLGFLVLVIVILGLGYFFYSRSTQLSDDYFRVSNRINESHDLLVSKKDGEAKDLYLKLKRLYETLTPREKNKLYPKIEELYNSILINEIEVGLEELKKNHDKALLGKVEKRFNSLSLKNKEMLAPLFNKIKEEFENEK